MPKPQTSQTWTPLFDTERFDAAMVIDAAYASELAYGRTGTLAAGWENVFASYAPPEGSDWSFAVGAVTDGYYVNGNASGTLLLKDGVLYVSFAGTSLENPLPDVVEYWQLDGMAMIAEYYEDVAPLMDAAKAFAEANPDLVTQVVATGHSLGGSAVDGALMANAGWDDLLGITFNSPTSGLVDDGRELNVGYENDLINEIVGNKSAGNAVHNLYYAVQPGEPMPEEGTVSDPMALFSIALQAWTSPAHDIARFPEALQSLVDSPVYQEVSRNDVVVLDGSKYAVSLDAMAQLSASFDKAMASSSRVGLVGQAGDDVLVGSRHGDAIDGGTGADTINGLGGNDLIWGGGDTDVLVFDGRFGRDVVKDYDGDVLSFTGGPAGGERLETLAELQQWAAETRQVSLGANADGDLVISFSGGKDSVTLEGIAAADWIGV